MPASPSTTAHQICREMLVEARKKAGLTQVQLAERLGRTQSFVAKYEKGERRIDVVELVELSKVLGFSPSGFVQRAKEDSALTGLILRGVDFCRKPTTGWLELPNRTP